MSQGLSKKQLREAGINYQCPECRRINGEHTDDCTLKMIGAGIEDPEEQISTMRRAIFDGLFDEE